MTSTVVNTSPVVSGLVAMLAATCRVPVGDGQAPIVPPDGEQGTPTYPWLIVYTLPGPAVVGDVGNPDSMRDLVVQITGVGLRRDQALEAVERAHQAILGRTATGWVNQINAPGVVVVNRAFESDGGIDREGPLFSAVHRFVFALSAV